MVVVGIKMRDVQLLAQCAAEGCDPGTGCAEEVDSGDWIGHGDVAERKEREFLSSQEITQAYQGTSTAALGSFFDPAPLQQDSMLRNKPA